MFDSSRAKLVMFCLVLQRKEKKRKDYSAFWRQFIEKPSIIPGCPGCILRIIQNKERKAGGLSGLLHFDIQQFPLSRLVSSH